MDKFKKLIAIDSNDIGIEKLREIAEKVVTYNDVPQTDEEITRRIGDADAVIFDWTFLKPEMFDICKNVKYAGGKFTGYGWFDWKGIAKKNITITYTPNYSKEAVAELTITHMLMLLNNIKENEKNVIKNEKVLRNEAEGKTLGIIGLGNIGSRVAEIAEALGMNIIYYSKTRKDSKYKYVELNELFKQSDIVSIHCDVNETSKGMINAEKIRSMKDGSILLNIASTILFKEDEIIPIIKEKKIKVGIDAFGEDSKINKGWLSIPGAVLTPHIGYYTEEALEKRNKMTLENAKAFLAGKPVNVVH